MARPRSSRWSRFELWACSWVLRLSSFGVATALGVGMVHDLEAGRPGPALFTGLFLAVAVSACAVAWPVLGEVRQFHAGPRRSRGRAKRWRHASVPRAVFIAVRRRRLPRPLRAGIVLWWVGFFLLGLLYALVAHYAANIALLIPGWPGWANSVLVHVLALLFTLAANLYLLLAVALAFGSPRALGRVWRFRFGIDTVLVLLGVGLALLL